MAGSHQANTLALAGVLVDTSTSRVAVVNTLVSDELRKRGVFRGRKKKWGVHKQSLELSCPALQVLGLDHSSAETSKCVATV